MVPVARVVQEVMPVTLAQPEMLVTLAIMVLVGQAEQEVTLVTLVQ